jgi:hypothetical protein
MASGIAAPASRLACHRWAPPAITRQIYTVVRRLCCIGRRRFSKVLIGPLPAFSLRATIPFSLGCTQRRSSLHLTMHSAFPATHEVARRSCLSQRGTAPCRQAGLGRTRKKAPSTSHSIMLRCGSAQNRTPARAERCSCQTGTRPILRLTGGASDLMRRRRSESRLSALPIQGRMLRAWPNRSAVPVAQGGT